MTYCVAIKTDSGLIFASDSLTNAGIDHVSTYSKMHTFVQPGERMFVLLSAGNLATTQGVVKRMRDDCRLGNQPCLHTAYSMSEAVDYVGNVSAEVQRAQARAIPPAPTSRLPSSSAARSPARRRKSS